MPTLAELIDKYRITIEVKEGAPPPGDGWGHGAHGYMVTLRRELGHAAEDPENDIAPVWAREDGMTLPFYMGSAHTKEPTAEDVLDCLLSDAAGYDNVRDFEEWAGEYGYDTDSRKAEALYEQIGEQRDELIRFLSDQWSYVRLRPGRGGFGIEATAEHYDEFMEAERD